MKITSLILSFLLLFGLSFQIKAQHRTTHNSSFDDRALVRAMSISDNAAGLIREIMESNRSFPTSIIDNAESIAVFPANPGIKPAFGGNDVGIVSIRDPQTGLWSPPIFLRVGSSAIKHQVEQGKDFFLFAMNRPLAEAFLTDRELKIEFTRGDNSGDVAEPGTRSADASSGFIAFLRDRGNFVEFGSAADNSSQVIKIVQANDLNGAVYGESRITRFLPVSQLVPSRVLTFTNTLNQYARRPEA